MGIPLGVYLSPVLLALAIIVTDLVIFLVPTADVGGAVWSLLDRLIEGDPGTIQAIAWILVIWSCRASSSSSCVPLVAWRLRRIGGEGTPPWPPDRRTRPIPRRRSSPTS